MAILPTLGKFFESVVCDSLNPQVKYLVSPAQHGFMGGRSTVTNLLEFSNFALNTIESCEQVDV